uniref:Dynein light chain Tctex-type n=1 Tax=Echinococcus canadensis TaxID=519352 RepID=A0A915EYS6_9CEST
MGESEEVEQPSAFSSIEVSAVIKDIVANALTNNKFQSAKMNAWASEITEQCLYQLTKLNRPFKYLVTCVIMQKDGTSLYTGSTCYWDATTDGNCTIKWENGSMYCIVTCFGLAI